MAIPTQLNQLPPPPKGQTGITLDQFKHLPPPPKGQQGLTLSQISQKTLASRITSPVTQGVFGTLTGPLREGISGLGTLYGGSEQSIASKISQNIQAGAKDIQAGGFGGDIRKANLPLIAKGVAKAGVRTAGDVAGTIYAPLGAAIGATGIGKLTNWLGSSIANSDLMNKITDIKAVQDFAVKHPNAGEDFGRALNLLFAAKEKGKIEPTTAIPRTFGQIKGGGGGGVGSLFKRKSTSIDDVMTQADEALGIQRTQSVDITAINKKMDMLIAQGRTAEARALAEATAPNVTLKEKLAGLRPDIKQRIQGKPELMQEYIDVVNTRNLKDTTPSVFEHGGDFARKATNIMKRQLDETGGIIGATRKKLGTIQAPIGEVVKIESSFVRELNRLNLDVRNGQVIQRAGTVSRIGSAGDLKLLNQLYKDLLIVKQSPTLTNLIDFRSGLDSRVNFAKQAREVSSAVDPFARQVRKSVADTSAKIVGKTEAGELTKYSDFMDAYNDIKYYTDKNAGGEYLLRLVLSGRGGEARKIIQTIKENTGIDLMDHATMMQVTNEMLGNAAQKNLFRQEITNAGLDVAALLKGDPRGAALMLFDKAVDRFVNPEKILMEAARK